MGTLLRDVSPSPPRPDYWETPREMEVEELDEEIWLRSVVTTGEIVLAILVIILLVGVR